VEKEVIKIVEVEKRVAVEKIIEVEKPVVITKEVIKEVILIATPTPTTTGPVGQGQLRSGETVDVTWNVSNLRTGSPGDLMIAQDWVGQLEKNSNGRIDIHDRYSEEAGVSSFQMLSLVRSGLVDITTAGFATSSGEFPIGEGGDLPGLHKSGAHGVELMSAFVPAIEDRFAKAWNSKFLSVFPLIPVILYCRGDVTGLNDLKDLKIRVYSAALHDFFNYFGAQPVSISFGEVYTALERGLADCGFTGGNAGLNAGWYEVTDTLVNIPFHYAFNFYAASLDSWDRLPSDVTEYLEFYFGGAIQTALTENTTNRHATDVACLTGKPTCPDDWALGKKGNMKEVTRSPGDSDLIAKALVEAVLPGWVARCGKECGEIWNQTVAPLVGFEANLD